MYFVPPPNVITWLRTWIGQRQTRQSAFLCVGWFCSRTIPVFSPIVKATFFVLGKPYTPPQLAKALLLIREICRNRNEPAPGVSALTSLDRDTWADVRDHMIRISESNRSSLETIDTSIAVFSFDNASPSVRE